MTTFNTKGSLVALITPMLESGEVDYNALENLVAWHIASGTDGIVSMGTTGESATLDNAEHLEVIKKTVQFANGNIPIIAGTGANSTKEALYLTQEAATLGVDACLLVTPYYNKPTQEGLYHHYKYIAEKVNIPQILYNVPGRTAVDMLPETIEQLSHIKNIVGIKDATGDLNVAKKLMELLPTDFLKYSGDDATAMEFVMLGGDGGISVSANICPSEVAKIYHLASGSDDDKKAATQLNTRIADLHHDLFIESNPIPVKWALHLMQKCESGIRLPLLPLSPNSINKLTKTLQHIGVI
jgi:4-hydroxy-tetrahydrodipicolinate synthase